MLEHMDDLKSLIQSQKECPVHLVGHSYGAFICLLLAIHDPNLIRTLVLSEPPAITLFVSFPPKLHELLKLLFIHPPTALSILKFGIFGVAPAEKAIKKDRMDKTIEIFGKATLGSEYFNLITEDRLMQIQQNLIKAEFLDSGIPELEINKIKMINTPTLLITGENSPALFYYIVNRLKELLPKAEWLKIPNASHIVHEDNPTFYNRSIISFLHKHSGTH
jgi:pimeloyl-ACP methyl ester carboxylesterase